MRCPTNYIGIVKNKSGKFNKFILTHKGVDFGWDSKHGGANQPIYACEDGIVVYKKYQSSGGYVLGIYHEKYNMTSEYGHLKKGSILVALNTRVSKGQMIASMGGTGKVSGNHLHFGLQKGKGLKYGLLAKWVDPLKYLNVYDGQTTSTNGTKDLIPHTKKVTAKDGLNVRNKPSVKGGIVYTAKYNTQVETHGIKNGWNIVDNVLGYYCSNKYIK